MPKAKRFRRTKDEARREAVRLLSRYGPEHAFLPGSPYFKDLLALCIAGQNVAASARARQIVAVAAAEEAAGESLQEPETDGE